PFQCFLVVLGNTPAPDVHEAEIGLSFGIALLSGLAKPLQCFLVVLRRAQPAEIHDADEGFSFDMALLSGLARPLQCFLVVLRHAPPDEIHRTEIELSPRVSLVREMEAGTSGTAGSERCFVCAVLSISTHCR